MKENHLSYRILGYVGWGIAGLIFLPGCISSTSVNPSSEPYSNSSPNPSLNSSPKDSPNLTAPSSSNAESDALTTAAEAGEWNLLRQGTGYVVMLRHALAPGTGDPANFRLGDCTTQRNLSEAGRQQATQIGATFRQYQIPVDAVFSSQWCRCLETAELMNLGEVEPLPALNSFFQDRSTEPQQTVQVQQLIRDRRNTSGVTILVTHQVNITAITGIVPASGGMVVLRANGDTVEMVGEIPAVP